MYAVCIMRSLDSIYHPIEILFFLSHFFLFKHKFRHTFLIEGETKGTEGTTRAVNTQLALTVVYLALSPSSSGSGIRKYLCFQDFYLQCQQRFFTFRMSFWSNVNERIFFFHSKNLNVKKEITGTLVMQVFFSFPD